ncbi:MAG: FKBP-type peptidyl-prolyl cis-trans isomerase [Sphingomicrobium sp.]
MNRLSKLLSLAALALAGCAPVPAPVAVPAAAPMPVVNVPPQTAAGPDFLVRNGAASGVVTTPSGLEYFIVRSGPPSVAPPAAEDTVSFDYEGKLLTGETFDSSYTEGHPLVGQVNKFVPGFSEALELMRPGDEWIVWIPPELGYGAKEVGPIPANSVLRFKLVLHGVTRAPAP